MRMSLGASTQQVVEIVASNGEHAATIVWVHGYGEHSQRYRQIADDLAKRGIRSVLFDLPGHGLDGGSPGDLPSLEQLHNIVIDALPQTGERPVLLFGHSLGGLIVATFLQRYPGHVNGAVFSSPVLGSWNAIEAFSHLEMIPPSPVRAHHLSRAAGFRETYEQDTLIYRGPLRRSALAVGAEALDCLATGLSEEAKGTPVLWLHGASDRIAPQSEVLRGLTTLKFQDLTARVFPQGRHELLHDEEAHEALGEILRFVDRVSCK